MSSADIAPSSLSPHSSAPTTRTGLAPLACLGCKLRKKGCDKKLPSCSNCARRFVICHYDVPATAKGPAEVKDPEVKLIPPTATVSHPLPKTGDIHPSTRAFSLLAHSLSPSPVLPNTFDAIFHLRIYEIIRAYGKYVDDITVRYFKGVHRWLPIISRSCFHDRLVGSQSSIVADFSLLLLSMCLITYIPEPNSSNNDREALYLTTKMLFAHAQTFIPTSTCMIQAGLLIATYEYAHGSIEAAYISIGTCVRMGHAAGLRKDESSRSILGRQPWPTLKDEEAHNLWWGIVICERFILSEKSIASQPFGSEFPDVGEYLPVDSDRLDERPSTDAGASHRHQISALASQDIGNFGREVQAAYLYSCVQEAIYIKENLSDITQLKVLDSKLQSFFADITCQSGTTWGLYCGSISFVIAALFDLHEFILQNSVFHNSQETSRAAIEATVRIVVDIAQAFNQQAPLIDLEALPPRCSHLARAAQNLVNISDHSLYEESKMALSDIRKMLTTLDRRWGMAGKQLARLEVIFSGQTLS